MEGTGCAQTDSKKPAPQCQPALFDAMQNAVLTPSAGLRMDAGLHRLASPAVTHATRGAGAMLYEILGMAELIRVAFEKGELASAQERLALLITETNRLSLALSNILELTSLETEPLEADCESFDIVALLGEISQAAGMMAGQKPVKVMHVSSPGPIIIRSDRFRIGRIMIGLMSNAVKFTDRGRVAMILSKDEDIVRLTVTDTGRGMSKEQITSLFGDSPVDSDGQTQSAEAPGLGLPIVKRTVKLLGGTISASSRIGEGTIVEVSLPLTRTTSPHG